jgi:hypothetical protein
MKSLGQAHVIARCMSDRFLKAQELNGLLVHFPESSPHSTQVWNLVWKDIYRPIDGAPRPSIIGKALSQCVVGKSATCRPRDRASASSSYEATDREKLSVETGLLEFQSSLCGLATSLSAQARRPPIALIFLRCGEIARNTIDFPTRN